MVECPWWVLLLSQHEYSIEQQSRRVVQERARSQVKTWKGANSGVSAGVVPSWGRHCRPCVSAVAGLDQKSCRQKPRETIHPRMYLFIPSFIQSFIFAHLRSHSFTLFHIHSHSFTFVHIHSHSFTFIHIHSHSLSFIHIRSHSFAFIHIHSHSFTFVHIRSHSFLLIFAFTPANSRLFILYSFLLSRLPFRLILCSIFVADILREQLHQWILQVADPFRSFLLHCFISFILSISCFLNFIHSISFVSSIPFHSFHSCHWWIFNLFMVSSVHSFIRSFIHFSLAFSHQLSHSFVQSSWQIMFGFHHF